MTTPPASPTPPPAGEPTQPAAAPTPSGPPPAPAPTAGPRRSGGISPLLIAALVGAIVVIAATFAPWFAQEGGDAQSGWDFYDKPEQTENGGFYFNDAFDDGVPLVTGLSTIVAGVVVAAVALALIAARGSDNDGLRGFLAFLGIAAGILVLVAAGTNLVGFLRKNEALDLNVQWGMVVVWAAALVSATIIPAAVSGGGGGGGQSSSSGPVV